VTDDEKIEEGDYVTVGESELTWFVRRLFSTGVATLRSGQTGRMRREPVGNLKLFKKGGAE
jgi:hypothetical protein